MQRAGRRESLDGIVSKLIARLDFGALEPGLAGVLRARVERLGYLGEFFRVLGHQPKALTGFVEFTEAAKAGVDKKLIELLALTVASHLGNAYERNQHERLSVRLGFGREWVAAVEKLEPDTAPLLDERERRLQRFALESIRSHGNRGQDGYDDLVREHGVEASVAMLMILGRYVAHAYMVNTLRLEPPVPSIWEDGFKG
jgi:alkylhydroperoxidase family enzyme